MPGRRHRRGFLPPAGRGRRPILSPATLRFGSIAFLATGSPVLAPPIAPATIDTAALGTPAFAEDFRTLDQASYEEQPRPRARWRTTFGYGGPAALDNRKGSERTVFVDRTFRGVQAGRLGPHPLGLEPFATGGSGLVITARRVPDPLRAELFGAEWMSGMVNTRFSFTQPWGYWEVTADLPHCVKGAWPAIWLLGLGQWPDSGEVDFPETIGDGRIYWSLHSKGNAGAGISGGVTSETAPTGGCVRGLHRYGTRVTAKSVGFYYDGRLVAERPTPPGFGKPMFLILQLSVGGSWPDQKGLPDPAMQAVRMRVSRVRAWRLPG